MPPLQQVNAGRLIAHIDHAWDRRRQLQARDPRAPCRPLDRSRRRRNDDRGATADQAGRGQPRGAARARHEGRRSRCLPSRSPADPPFTLPPRQAPLAAEPPTSLVVGGGPAGLGAALGAAEPAPR